jgi:hypothetical protein
MKYAVTGFRLAICLAVLSAAPAFTQTPSDEAISDATTAAPVAYVYVQTNEGVNAYGAAANGSLTLVKGSPFKTSGEMIGSTGKYFITLGLHWVHAYAVESNGAIGEQVSKIDTLDYGGGDCETYPPENLVFGTDGAVLDRAGQNVYVFLNGTYDDGGGCAAYQTFNIAKSGELTFNAVDEWYTPAKQQPRGGLIFTGNDKFGYAMIWNWGDSETPFYTVNGFKRGSQGALEGYAGSYGKDPVPPPGYEYNPGCVNCSSSVSSMAADPTDHLAFVITAYSVDDPYASGATQLASYTVDSKGNVVSTNTWKNMPAVEAGVSMAISPSGKLLVVNIGPGLQLYHFNGADPIKPYGAALNPTTWFSQMQWDNNNHLYVLCPSGFDSNPAPNRLYVYTITSTSISQAPGSPFTIPVLGNGNSLVVVPK